MSLNALIPNFHILGIEIGPYGIALVLAITIGVRFAVRESRRHGLPPDTMYKFFVQALVAGLLGAKLLLLIVDWNYYTEHPSELIRAGGVFYGGLIAGILAGVRFTIAEKLDPFRVADAIAAPIVLAQGIGRLGCLAAGCCYGKACDLPWAVTLEHGPVHPTPLYESLATLSIFALLLWLTPRRRFFGQLGLTYLMLYSATRFGIEYFRGDSYRGFVFDVMSTSQFIALIAFVGAAVTALLLLGRAAKCERMI